MIRNLIVTCLMLMALMPVSAKKSEANIDLSGEWRFAIDREDKGVQEKWYNQPLADKVNLPGSMTTNGKGDDITLKTPWTGTLNDASYFTIARYEKYRQPDNIKVPFFLQPIKYYVGAAWYQKEVTIPADWKGKAIQLFLERCHWETSVWIDGKEAGMQNALGAPHRYDLTQWLVPGKHTITVRVDNRVKEINVGPNSSSITDHTQTNWNGMVGKLELQATPSFFVSDVKVYPNLADKKVKVRITLNNSIGKKINGTISLQAQLAESGQKLTALDTKVFVENTTKEIELYYPMGSDPMLWDEFHPNLYKMGVSLASGKGKDAKEVTFGMREFKTKGTQFTINGRPTMLRGTLECAIFPKTGYPSTDRQFWMDIYKVAKAHGLNHFRFHSWCPPEAAFEAADKIGLYLHIECSSWANDGATIGDGKPLDKFIYEESERIVNAFGNHPSFCMMLYGNEPSGKGSDKWLADFDTYWKKKDSRRLYSTGAGWPILPESDFNSTPAPRIQQWGEQQKSVINAQPPRSDYDWTSKLPDNGKPTVSHEIGQWCVYPDFKEIAQYDGVMKARNFEIFKETLKENHMAQLADSFLLASGKLQALCYKADIEAALRTPGFGGFQLLDLHDFPGQGTALVGVLNPFWKEKGYITPQEYSRFCNATVPLVRLPKMIYLSNETLTASVEISHFGEKPLNDVVPAWKLVDPSNTVIAQGTLAKTEIPIGNGTQLGVIRQSLSGITKAVVLRLIVSVENAENSWDIWVYPSTLPEVKSETLVTQKLDAKAIETLNKGGKVLLTITKGSVKEEKGGSVAVGFSSIFWNTSWTNGQAPHTLGILCDPKHPALADFPTEYHSNWQWWDAMSHSNAILLSDFALELKPIVRLIDDWFTNRPLGLIFEVKVGKGFLLISGADLLTDADKRPEARQLLYSLKRYMAGTSFHPATAINADKLQALFQ